MSLLKFFLSLSVTILFIWALNRPYLTGEAAHTVTLDSGEDSLVQSTQRFIPPIGKVLSPSHGFWQNAEGKAPDLASEISDEYLSAPVKVVYDDRMVPHIFAQNMADASFAQGYVTASLRLWQMELQTHMAAGRLTEILGTTDKIQDILIERDKHTRRIGIPLGAKNTLEHIQQYSKEELKPLDAYTAGVNAYINSLDYDDLPLFYKLRDYKPESWTNFKTILLLKAMARTLTDRDLDFELTTVLKHIGLDKYNDLYGEYFEEQSPIIHDSLNYIQPVVIEEDKPITLYLGKLGMDSLTRAYSPKGIGSNNWAVSGAKTASGNPILCNDPHLELNLPSIWFEVQISTPEFNCYGASLPGAPGVISGFNEHIAWGVTNVGHDVKDWYAIQWKDDTKTSYWFDSTYKEASAVIEEIKVRGAASVFDTIFMTHIGPIAHSVDDQDFALRWTLHDASEEPMTFVKLMHGKNYEDYKDAIKHFSCPAQNIIFAAKNGDIALWTQGKLPLRKEMQGRFVQQGTSSDELWQGFIPQKDIPHEYNPAKNFVGSANQHSVNPSLYPYDFYGYFEEYRGRYLNRRLAEMDSITVQDMMALQYDAYSVRAEDFMPVLTQHLQKGKLTKEELEVWHLLKDWDYRYTKEAIAPTIFETWFDTLRYTVYDEILGIEEDGEKIDEDLIRFPAEYNLLHLVKRDTGNVIFDIVATEGKEYMADVLTMVFKNACKYVPRDSNKAILPWKAARGTTVDHLSKASIFSVEDIDSDGHVSTLNALGKRPGPSWRMVVELGNNIKAYGIYPGGQSENPGSFYYQNMLEKWAKGEHYQLLFLKNSEDQTDRIIHQQDFVQ